MECYKAILSSFYCVGGYSIKCYVLYQGNLKRLMWISVNYHTGRPQPHSLTLKQGRDVTTPGPGWGESRF